MSFLKNLFGFAAFGCGVVAVFGWTFILLPALFGYPVDYVANAFLWTGAAVVSWWIYKAIPESAESADVPAKRESSMQSHPPRDRMMMTPAGYNAASLTALRKVPEPYRPAPAFVVTTIWQSDGSIKSQAVLRELPDWPVAPTGTRQHVAVVDGEDVAHVLTIEGPAQ